MFRLETLDSILTSLKMRKQGLDWIVSSKMPKKNRKAAQEELDFLNPLIKEVEDEISIISTNNINALGSDKEDSSEI